MNINEMTPEQLEVAQKWIDAVKKIVYTNLPMLDTAKFNNMQEEIDEASGKFLCNFRRFKAYPDNHVFDENQTVKWNREKVKTENDERQKTLEKLRKEVSELEAKREKTLLEEASESYGIPMNAIEKLWSKAYDEGHSEGFSRSMEIFESELDLFREILGACVGVVVG